MHIISVSRRTDIPAFYPEWFINRVRQGWCLVRNPYYPQKELRVSLRKEDVQAFVFWTRNPRPLMKYLPELDRAGYVYYFQYTLIGYPKEIDPCSPELEKGIATFRELSSLIGKEKVIWRYDPIFFSQRTSPAWHFKRIEKLTRELKGFTRRMVISFIDPYEKTKKRMSALPGEFRPLPSAYSPQAYRELAAFIGEKAKKQGMEVYSCAEEIDLSRYGILQGKCVDDAVISSIIKEPLKLKKASGSRRGCRCVISRDIGAYDSCLFGCAYCYATRDLKAARDNFLRHDKESPYLAP